MTNKKYAITTDSGCDLTYEQCLEYGIIPLKMSYTDGENIYKDEMKNEKLKEFYRKMEEGINYKTSAVNVKEAFDFLENIITEYDELIHISLGSGISGTYNNMLLAKDMILEKYPNKKIYIIDSIAASLGYGMLAIEASIKRRDGMSIEEVVEYLEEKKHKMNVYFTTSTLTYLARGGRVSNVAAVFGNILSIKPILKLDVQGCLEVHCKGHGKKNTFAKVQKLIEDTIINPEEQTLFVVHSLPEKEVEDYIEELKKKINFKNVFCNYLGTIIGAHTGPGLIAFFCFGKNRL